MGSPRPRAIRNARSALRADPTRTATLRRALAQNLAARFLRLRQAIGALVAGEDAFGLKRQNRIPSPGGLFANTRWRALTDPEKLRQFQAWLKTQIDQGILLATGTSETGGVEGFIGRAYTNGGSRAFDQVRKGGVGQNLDFYEGTRAEFLRSAFGGPVAVEKVNLLASRTFTDLKGVTEAMSTQISRELAQGMIEGTSPREIARKLNDRVDKIGIVRARAIARTEIIRAHAEGQLDALQKLGVAQVGVAVEWSTAGDDLVCPLCADLEGIVMKLTEARGIIPRHPNCRCMFVPANVGEDKRDQKRSKSAIDRAISSSLRREIPKKSRRSVDTQRRRSQWAGAGKKIARKRPKELI